MNSKNNNYLIISLFTLLTSITSKAQNQNTYLLEYKFRLSQRLHYKTGQHDSVVISSENQTTAFKTTTRTIKSLFILSTPPNKPYTISIQSDSVWTDQKILSPKKIGKGILFLMLKDPPQKTVKLTSSGKPFFQYSHTSPFLIPLPEKSVAINDTWEFEITTLHKEQIKGKTTINGHCILYDVQKEDEKNLALIIVSAESKSKCKLNLQGPRGKISGSFTSKGTFTGLVYFDINKGHVTEVIINENHESNINSSSSSSLTKSSTSTSTIKLIPE